MRISFNECDDLSHCSMQSNLVRTHSHKFQYSLCIHRHNPYKKMHNQHYNVVNSSHYIPSESPPPQSVCWEQLSIQ